MARTPFAGNGRIFTEIVDERGWLATTACENARTSKKQDRLLRADKACGLSASIGGA